LRFDGERIVPCHGQLNAAKLARHEILEVASVRNNKREFRSRNLNKHVTSALPFAATLPDFNLERARARYVELPIGPIVRVGPITKAVLVRLRLVPHQHAVVVDPAREGDAAGGVLRNGFPSGGVAA
jgi:hypothetical protein